MKGDKPKKVDDPATPTPSPAPASAQEPEKPIKVSKGKFKRPDLPIPAQPAPAAPAPAATPAAPRTEPPETPNWENDLLDAEREALEDARFAETLDPKFKGLGDRTATFLKRHKAFLDKNPEPEDDDPEYQKILALKPDLSPSDKRRIIEGRVSTNIKKEYDGRFDDVQHELYIRDEEPKIAQEGQRLFNQLADVALPKEMKDHLKANGLEALEKDYGDEMEIAGAIVKTAVSDAQELLRLVRVSPKTKRPLSKVAEDESDPRWEQHNRIVTLLDRVCEDIKNSNDPKQIVRDGKYFVTRDEWNQLPQAMRGKYWTFLNNEADMRQVINHAFKWIPGTVDHKIKEHQDAMKARGYQRVRSALAPTPGPTPAPTPSAHVPSVTSPRPSPMPVPTAPTPPSESRGSLLAKKLSAG